MLSIGGSKHCFFYNFTNHKFYHRYIVKCKLDRWKLFKKKTNHKQIIYKNKHDISSVNGL